MIRAAHLGRLPFRFGHHRRGMMSADVKEAAQLTVAATNDHNRFIANFGRNVIAAVSHLIQTRRNLP